jgi:cob(I)alamin adenosyltransferase
MKYSETAIGDYVKNITVEQLGKGCFISNDPIDEDRRVAGLALKRCNELMTSGYYDVMILDEVTIALHYKLIKLEEVITGLKARAPHVEVVITGRYAPEELITFADLVTEMVEIKHYYKEGVLSRKGIDC